MLFPIVPLFASLPLVTVQANLVTGNVLRYGTPESVGMLSEPLQKMVSNLTAYTRPANYSSFSKYAIHPIQPGGTVLVGHEATVVSAFAFGHRLLYASGNGTKLPLPLQERATLDTVYDMASLSKMFASVAALRLMDAGLLELDATVASYIPQFAVNGKENVTIRMLVGHTSGFDADPVPTLWSSNYTTHAERIQAIITAIPINAPGSTYLYSDINFMTLMIILETITRKKLDVLVAEFTSLLGMSSTFYNRNNVEGPKNVLYQRTAPTEFQLELIGLSEPHRPQPVRGTVHDENAWALGGVSGHAGLFSTVTDTAAFCQMILNNGTYGNHRILSQESVDLIFTNINSPFKDVNEYHGFGFELNQYYTAGPLNSTLTASHTGFTGTSMVIDRPTNTFYLHFSNRVHPSRSWSSPNIIREAVGYWVGTALGFDLEFPPLH